MVSLKSESDNSDLCIFLFSGLIAFLFLGIYHGDLLEFILFVLFVHILGGTFIWRKTEQWRFVLGCSWKRVLLTLFGFLFACGFLMTLIILLCSLLENFGISSERSAILGGIVTSWSLAFLWPFLYWIIKSNQSD